MSRLLQGFQDDGNVNIRFSTYRLRVATPNEDRTTVSRRTAYRRLEQIGPDAHRPVRCVPLTASHCHLHLAWSREHVLCTPQQWTCMMFSDESRFSLQTDSRRTF
ncbi:transposable element Tcb1 transposase [Trichonephila clavipes]|nr:transposable element Tcb1 transposase [Trichonephila clavipes]